MFWREKVQKFSRTEVEFSLNEEYVIVRKRGEIGVFRDELPDKFVGVFYQTFSPRGVRVSEIDLGVQHFCDELVFSELGSVVGGDGKDVMFKWPEHLYHEFGHSFSVLALGGVVKIFRGLTEV